MRRKAIITQTAAAEKLGVTVTHLNKVLRGRIVSKRLSQRYSELIEFEEWKSKGSPVQLTPPRQRFTATSTGPDNANHQKTIPQPE